MSKQIVAFGDSNTRFYYGDTMTPGPIEEAWPARSCSESGAWTPRYGMRDTPASRPISPWPGSRR